MRQQVLVSTIASQCCGKIYVPAAIAPRYVSNTTPTPNYNSRSNTIPHPTTPNPKPNPNTNFLTLQGMSFR